MTKFHAEPSRTPQPGTYAVATEQAFGGCPNVSGLQLLSVESRHGFVAARFEGPIDDFRGPYGVVIRLPRDQLDEQWTSYAGSGTVYEWAHAAVAMRAVNAHAASADQDREYSPDGTWWLVRDTHAE
ncbi:hypothetical protein IWX65_002703 [Arthrobacter sp. CAN_A214]|uniref:hypothetical protein n=1 Tax=Arthrobacter sp. CAN_A214 TaxID=2787720 RepID=UPI0018CB8045